MSEQKEQGIRNVAVDMLKTYRREFAPKREWVKKTVKRLLKLHDDMTEWLSAYNEFYGDFKSELRDDQLMSELETAAKVVNDMMWDIGRIVDYLTEELYQGGDP